MEARASRSVRNRPPREGSRRRLPSALSVAAIALGTGGVPATVFQPGRDLCKVVPLAAIRSAARERYTPGIFAAGTCTWERPDLAGGVTLSTHPRPVGLTLMRQFLLGQGLPAARIHLSGAAEAVLVQISSTSKDLFAAYRKGVIQVDMTSPGGPPTARLLAVMRLVAPKA